MNKKILALAMLGVVGFGVAFAETFSEHLSIIIKVLWNSAKLNWGIVENPDDDTVSYSVRSDNISTTKIYWLSKGNLVEANLPEGEDIQVPDNAEPLINFTIGDNQTRVLVELLDDSENADKCVLHIVGEENGKFVEVATLDKTSQTINLCKIGENENCTENKTWYGYIEFKNKTACKLHLNVTVEDTGVQIPS